jgi:hypothetical protein
MSITRNNREELAAAHEKASEAAAKAAQAFLDTHFGGEDHGACGFAWVTFYPAQKGNTRVGKYERKMIESIGFRKDYTGKAWQLWNPSKIGAQNIDAKEAGAAEYARVLEAESGVRVSVGSRLD